MSFRLSLLGLGEVSQSFMAPLEIAPNTGLHHWVGRCPFMLGTGNSCGRVLSCPGTSGVRGACTVRSLHQMCWQVKIGKIWLEPRVSGLASPPFPALGSFFATSGWWSLRIISHFQGTSKEIQSMKAGMVKHASGLSTGQTGS